MENEPEVIDSVPTESIVPTEPTQTDLDILKNLQEMNEKLVTQNELLSNQQTFDAGQAVINGDYQTNVLEKLDTINLTIDNANTMILDKLTTLIDAVLYPTLSDNTLGIYGLIAIPAIFVIFILYKLIAMWIRPFI